MMTVGILALIVGVGIALAFAGAAARRGAPTNYLWICWLPLGGFAATVIERDRLGLGLIAVMGVILLASAGLAALGVVLTVRALRHKDAAAGPLIWGTLVAAAPWWALAGGAAFRALRH